MELIVKYQATELVTNFEDVKNEVIKQVEKYSIDVTDENLKEAKQVMADLNKVKAGISDKYKQYIDSISQPINQLKTEKKELEAIITNGRQKIADEVANYENKKLEVISETINAYKVVICKEKNIEHNAVTIDDLVKLSAVTTNGSLAKATKEAVDLRVQAVENEILKAKLEAEEKAKRDKEIAEKAKLEAEERAKQREAELLAKAEREKAEAIEKAKIEAKQEAKAEMKNETPTKEAPPRQTDDGKMIYTIQATFEVKANVGLDDEVLMIALNNKLKEAGITNCLYMQVL